VNEGVGTRVRELLARAGLGSVPPAALVAIGVAAITVVAIGVVRWSPGSGSEGDQFAFEEAGAAGDVAAEGDVAAGDESGVVASEESSIVVYVVGAVRHPGVVRLGAGARVEDAVAAAGGFLGNAAMQAVNLARFALDGEQIVVPTLDEYAAAPQAAPGSSGAPGPAEAAAPVDLNTADATTLETLPGVGPATASKIVADRETNGPFASVEDIMRVPGIGEKKFESLKDLIVVR
jgi:competence protein ComEA